MPDGKAVPRRESCGNCWYCHDDGTTGGAMLECRRGPPAAGGCFSPVTPDLWCGEHKRRPTVITESGPKWGWSYRERLKYVRFALQDLMESGPRGQSYNVALGSILYRMDAPWKPEGE